MLWKVFAFLLLLIFTLVSMAVATYYIRRVLGIILYSLAYAALWPGLTHPMVSIQGNPAFWSNGKLGLAASDAFLVPRTRSTIELVVDLLDSGLYFPCIVIFVFSVVSPVIKLLVLLYGEIKGNIFRVHVEGKNSIVDLRRILRTISKYQTVDVFVALITRELINSDFIKCEILDGFYYFFFYSFISILASQVIDAPNPHIPSTRVYSVSKSSKLDKCLLFCSLTMFAVGMGWSLGFPILAVKFLFQSKIVIGETVASLTSFILPSMIMEMDFYSQIFVSSWIVLLTVVIIPTLVVFLSIVIQCCGCRPLVALTEFLSAWSLIDVFAVALLTNLFAFASFSELRTIAPWGFYCVLMAAMSAHEVVARATQEEEQRYEPLEPIPMEEFNIGKTEEEEASSEESLENGPFGPVSPRKRTIRKKKYIQLATIEDARSDGSVSPRVPRSSSGVLHVLITITRRLGLPFFILKALGWGIFFMVWFLNSGAGSLDLPSLSATLKANTPLVTSALQTSLPFAIGDCAQLLPTNGTCVDKGPQGLHYEKHTAYEILARWMSGFPSVNVSEMQISVPSERRFLLSVSGTFSEISLSLFIGQCLSSIFGDHDETHLPICSKLFDSVHKWSNVRWSLGVRAECFVNSPYVRNIVIDAVQVHSEMKVEEEIAFGLSIPLDDLGEHFRDGIKESIEPLLMRKNGWIPWGTKNFDLVALLSHLVELNIDSHGGTLGCPTPK